MSMLDTAEKGEAAIKAVIVSAQDWVPAKGAPEDEVFVSFTVQELPVGTDFVVIACQGGAEDGQNSGNERLTFSIQIHSVADATPDETVEDPVISHRNRVGDVYDVLRFRTIHTLLTDAVTAFTVFDSVKFRRGPNRVVGRKFVSEIFLELSCAPSDVS